MSQQSTTRTEMSGQPHPTVTSQEDMSNSLAKNDLSVTPDIIGGKTEKILTSEKLTHQMHQHQDQEEIKMQGTTVPETSSSIEEVYTQEQLEERRNAEDKLMRYCSLPYYTKPTRKDIDDYIRESKAPFTGPPWIETQAIKYEREEIERDREREEAEWQRSRQWLKAHSSALHGFGEIKRSRDQFYAGCEPAGLSQGSNHEGGGFLGFLEQSPMMRSLDQESTGDPALRQLLQLSDGEPKAPRTRYKDVQGGGP